MMTGFVLTAAVGAVGGRGAALRRVIQVSVVPLSINGQ